jgi:alpha-N-arabinofuranosidase
LPEVGGIDPSLFFDDDGKAWIINNEEPAGGSTYGGHRALWVQQFNPQTLNTFGPRTMVVDGGADPAEKPIWIEGPHIFRRNGKLYLIAAEGGTSVQHSQVVFRADEVTGPWAPYSGNPILTQRHLDPGRSYPVTSAGHADFVRTPGGQWWAAFLATRPYRDNLYNTGRETFLMQVHWVDDWPVIARGDDLIPYVASRPDLPAQPAPPIPLTGNFTLREEFEGPLPGYWVMMRTPGEGWYDLKAVPGAITIKARPAGIGGFAQPSYLARRQQHAHATVTAAMRFVLPGHGDRAGLAALQNDEYYYFFGVRRIEGDIQLLLARRAGADEPVDGRAIKAKSLPAASNRIELRIKAGATGYGFEYRLPDSGWRLFAGNQDGTLLSTEVAQGFVGATLGMYAYTPGSGGKDIH